MSVTYRPEVGNSASLDAEAVRATYRRSGGRGVERAYGWTPAVIAILRGERQAIG